MLSNWMRTLRRKTCARLGSQHPSPNVKSFCNFKPHIWPEVITSHDAESTCFKDSRTSCDVISFGIFGPNFGRKRSHHVMDASCRKMTVMKFRTLRKKKGSSSTGMCPEVPGYPDTKVIDPVKENFPACTMPLSCTTPAYITPAIPRNRQCAKEYLAHLALIRKLLDQSSLTTHAQLLLLSSNRLFQSLSGLLTHSSDIYLTREPIPVWNLVRVVR